MIEILLVIIVALIIYLIYNNMKLAQDIENKNKKQNVEIEEEKTELLKKFKNMTISTYDKSLVCELLKQH